MIDVTVMEGRSGSVYYRDRLTVYLLQFTKVMRLSMMKEENVLDQRAAIFKTAFQV